ncbi:MAG: TrkH family potassium uptake protein [Oscillospiraceae bacterium]|nr:TrkH family potassium uptake protein [Oscillospiraceae bacterium]
MNHRIIGKTTGTILLVEAACLLVPLICALTCGESVLPYLFAALIMVAVGFPLTRIRPGEGRFFARDGFAAAALGWIVMSLFGALPFAFSGSFASFADCVFESTSGFTTTGSTILTDIESLPRGLLLWRSFTHFIGGMGVVVLTTAILPTGGERAQFLMRAEVPGPTSDKLVPRLAESSKILYAIYVALTLLELVCLLVAGLSFYDALNVAFATAGTGGFSVLNASIGGYGSAAVELIAAVFMLAFALNFTVYFLIITKKWRQALRSEELRVFLITVAAATVIIAIDTAKRYDSAFDCARTALFTVASIISSTGFGVADHELWPELSKTILVLLMLMGACAGSTGGGLKVSRVVLAFRATGREIRQMVHPRSVNIVRLDGRAVDENIVNGVMKFVFAYFAATFLVTLLLSFENLNFTERFTAAVTCMSNIGPALGQLGPSGNFAALSVFSKLLLALTMIVGRLEIWPILILFSSYFVRKR